MNLPDEVYRQIYKNIFPLNDCIVEAQGRITIPNFGFRNETTYEYFEHHEVLDCLFEQFSDICSNGDKIINKMLEAINNCDWRVLNNLRRDHLMFYEIILDTWNVWVKEGYPDPHAFWAS